MTTRSLRADASTGVKSDRPRGRGWHGRGARCGTMAAVFRRRARIALVVALGLALVGPAAARADTVSASVTATPTGQSMGNGFVGVSFEYRALHQYTGRDPLAVDPVL